MLDRLRILICDDDPELVRSLELSLRAKYEVNTAGTVEHGKRLIKTNQFDVAIIDLNFEGQDQDGIDLIDFSSVHCPSMVLLVLSGDDLVKRVVEAHRRKLFEFILKEADFFETLNIALERISQNKQTQQLAVEKYLTNSKKVKEVLT
jgi:DNA-binding NtrC family response regulator